MTQRLSSSGMQAAWSERLEARLQWHPGSGEATKDDRQGLRREVVGWRCCRKWNAGEEGKRKEKGG